MVEEDLRDFSDKHALQVFEERQKAFRIIHDTIFAVEGVSETEIPAILCSNLLKICHAQFAALALFDSEYEVLRLEAVASMSGPDDILIERPVEKYVMIPSALEEDLKTEQVKDCCHHHGCLVELFAGSMSRIVKHREHHRCYRLSCVRDGQLIAAGMIQLHRDEKLKMKDLVDTYLNLAGMVLQRLSMISVLKKSERLYHSTIDAIDGYLHVVDSEFKLLLHNRSFEEELDGLKVRGPYIGQRLFEIFPFLDDEVKAQYQQVLHSGQTLRTEERNSFTKQHSWSETTKIPILDDQGKVYRIITLIRDITERKINEERITTSLKEKEVLLKEIHHRVKNNLQVISSLLSLQARNISNPQVLKVLKESQNRVRSMALIHEKLYKSQDLAHIDFNAYIHRLVKELARTYQVDAGRIALHVEVQNTFLEVDYAVPCGLIINELIANAFKYAFPPSYSGRGEIRVAMSKDRHGTVRLTVGDNGVGMPGAVDPREAKTLGLRMVTILVEDQLSGELRLHRGEGTTFEIVFHCYRAPYARHK